MISQHASGIVINMCCVTFMLPHTHMFLMVIDVTDRKYDEKIILCIFETLGNNPKDERFKYVHDI